MEIIYEAIVRIFSFILTYQSAEFYPVHYDDDMLTYI